MNGRISYHTLGQLVKLTDQGVYSRVKSLEKRYGINYLAEIDVGKLGFNKILIMAKFRNGVPTRQELLESCSKEPRIQLVLVTEGEYNLLICAIVEDGFQQSKLIYDISNKIIGYRAEWQITSFQETYNFIPLRQEFLEFINNNSTKGITSREANLLKEINKNGRIEFSSVERKMGFDPGRILYSYYNIKKKGILTRITISLDKLPVKYIGIILMRVIDPNKYPSKKKAILSNIINKSNSEISNYVVVGDIGSPLATLFFKPVFNEGEINKTNEEFKKLKSAIDTNILIITDVILGKFCYRRFDPTYSEQYQYLLEREMISTYKKTDYEKTE